MAPRIQKKIGAAQEPRKEDSPDWVGDGCIHSASNPVQTRANAEFDPMCTDAMPSLCGMLVYNETTSKDASIAPGEILRFLILFKKSVESRM